MQESTIKSIILETLVQTSQPIDQVDKIYQVIVNKNIN